MANAKRGGVAQLVLMTLFAVPFVLGGLAALWQGFVVGARPFIVFGLVFTGAGVLVVYQAVRKMRSPESLAVLQNVPTQLPGGLAAHLGGDAYRAPGRVRVSARELYGQVLDFAPLPKIVTTPGRVLPHTLPLSKVSGSPIATLIFGSVWTLITLPIFVVMAPKSGAGSSIFPGFFVLIGLVLIALAVRQLLSRTKLPRVEVSDEPVFLGETLRVHIEQPGPAQITRYRVDLECRERATYTIGTTTRTEEKTVGTYPMLDDFAEVVARGQPQSHDLEIAILKNVPVSFTAKRNCVVWLLRIRAEIVNWPDLDETYEVRIVPAPPA